MSSLRGSVPRIVVVARTTEYAALLARHGTREQASFFLRTRGRSIGEVQARDAAQNGALGTVSSAIPVEWRRARVERSDLDRFLFEPADIVVTVGPSGLVANVAKYLDGQQVVGISPDRARDGALLARHEPGEAAALLRAAVAGRAPIEERTMVEARLDDGQRVLALNEVFIGHRSHQSARYLLRAAAGSEHQSSSGVVVTTGTGATGWGRSISLERASSVALPAPDAPQICFFVREAWPSPSFGVTLTEGLLDAASELVVVSELEDGGVIFGDGIESDQVDFGWGFQATVRVAPERLRLVAGS